MGPILPAIYKEIAGYIEQKEGPCVLILGPELSVDQNNVPFRSFFRSIAGQPASDIFAYFENDNLFAFENEGALKETRRLIKDFYENSGDKTLLRLISRIKFPLIINLCPDIALNKVYDDCGIEYESGYFSKDSKAKFKNLPDPTKKKPVIYNIFGSVDWDSTLILDHSKLYETMQYLLPDNSLPDSIETFLSQASAFLLLGLKFDSWYYQLICHKVKLKEYNKAKRNLYASQFKDTESVSIVLRESFGIDFTPDNPTQAIEKIIAQCKDSDQALRPLKELASSSVYVSYAWKDAPVAAVVGQDLPPVASRETMVDWAQKYSALKEIDSLQFFRDHNELGYGDSIDSFMTRIGKGKTILRVISDKYLRSRYCMIEAMRMKKYQDSEKRIFTAIWEDADLENETVYLKHWEGKCAGMLTDLAKKLDNKKYDDYVAIYRFMTGFINEVADKVNLRIGSGDFKVDAAGEIVVVPERQAVFEDFIKGIIGKTKTQ